MPGFYWCGAPYSLTRIRQTSWPPRSETQSHPSVTLPCSPRGDARNSVCLFFTRCFCVCRLTSLGAGIHRGQWVARGRGPHAKPELGSQGRRPGAGHNPPACLGRPCDGNEKTCSPGAQAGATGHTAHPASVPPTALLTGRLSGILSLPPSPSSFPFPIKVSQGYFTSRGFCVTLEFSIRVRCWRVIMVALLS